MHKTKFATSSLYKCSHTAEANNSYSNFCEVTSKHFSFLIFVSNVIHKDLKLKCLGVTSQKPL